MTRLRKLRKRERQMRRNKRQHVQRKCKCRHDSRIESIICVQEVLSIEDGSKTFNGHRINMKPQEPGAGVPTNSVFSHWIYIKWDKSWLRGRKVRTSGPATCTLLYPSSKAGKAGIPRRRHGHRHRHPRRHSCEDRRENVGVSFSLPPK